MPRGEQLSRKQDQAVAALLGCKTLKEAAQKAGVAERTLRSWLEIPAFRAAYAKARRQILDRTVCQLLGATDQAVETLKRNLACGEAGSEIRAALGILDHAVKAVEMLDLAGEVERLKQQVEDIQRERGNVNPPGGAVEAIADGQDGDGPAIAGPRAG